MDPEPTVPVTVRVYVPAGVPTFLEPPPPPPPPPQAASSKVNNSPVVSSKTTHPFAFPSLRRLNAIHVIAARSRANRGKLRELGKRGWMGGSARGTLADGAVVVTDTVIFVAELLGVSGLGETEHVASEGAPVQAKVTAWLRPPTLPTDKV